MGIIDIKKNIEKILDDNKALNVTCIDLKNKSYIADYMVIASGTSSRHLQALSEILVDQLKKLSKEKGLEVHESFITAMINKQSREKFNNIVQFKSPAELLYKQLSNKLKDEA